MRNLFCMRCVVCIAAGVSTTCLFADDPTPANPAAAQTATLPVATPRPIGAAPADERTTTESGDSAAGSVAGSPDEPGRLGSPSSQYLYNPPPAIHSEDLSRKEAELECLQEEVDRLRELTGQSRAVVVRLVAIKFSRRNLGNRARELDALLGLRSGESPYIEARRESLDGASSMVRPAAFERPQPANHTVVDGDPLASPLFIRLYEAGALEILAKPTVTTTIGRPASMQVGGQFPLTVKTESGSDVVRMTPFGLQFELVANSLSNRRLRLQACFDQTEIKWCSTPGQSGGATPYVTQRRLNTEAVLESGQTLVICRTERAIPTVSTARPAATDLNSAQSEDSELIVFVTVDLLNPVDTPNPIRTAPPAEALRSDYHPTEGLQYYPAMPVLPRGLRR